MVKCRKPFQGEEEIINKPHYSSNECLMLTFVVHSWSIYISRQNNKNRSENEYSMFASSPWTKNAELIISVRVWVSDLILKNGTLQDKGVCTING